jgi:two-component system sensor histidine kinase UhpB
MFSERWHTGALRWRELGEIRSATAHPSKLKAATMPSLDVVCLEEDAAEAERVRLELLRTVQLRSWRLVSTHNKFLAALANCPPDLILADYRLANFDGREALAAAQKICPQVPFIFLATPLGEELAVETIKLGATDIVLKSRLERLPTAVARALAERQENRAREDEQAAIATQDMTLRRSVDAIPDVIYALDTNARITFANQALLRALDRSADDVMGRRIGEFERTLITISGDEKDKDLMKSRKSVIEREIRTQVAGRPARWHVYSKFPLIDSHTDGVTGLLVVSRDITESRVLEREILEITEREQRRVGVELHDGLGQELTGLGLMLKGLETELERDESHYLPKLRDIKQILQEAFRSAQSLSKSLAPTNLDHGGILTALEQLANTCTASLKIACEVSGARAIASTLTDSASSHLYRIAQEALTNAAKHAQAGRIVISLTQTGPEQLELAITDDGIGFEMTGYAADLGIGVRTMLYRARMLGGSMHATRESSGGTRIECRFPVRQNQRSL